MASGDRVNTLHLVAVSAGLYALAFFLTQVLHELGHALAGLAVGSGPVLYTAAVEHTREASEAGQVFRSAAGPLVSLVQGLVFLALLRLRTRALLKLFLIWMSYHGLINVVGYLFSGAFASGADVGRVWRLLGVPGWLRWVASALALGSFFFLTRLYLEPFRSLRAWAMRDAPGARRWARLVGLYPGLVATPLLLAASLPLPHWLSYLYVGSACMPLFSFPDAFEGQRVENPETSWRPTRKQAIACLALYLVTHALGRLLLDGGVAL